MLLPLGSPLPDDAVSAARGDSGVLAGLSVPLNWDAVVAPDGYDDRAPKPEDLADAGDTTADAQNSPAPADGAAELDEWNEWRGRDGNAEPHFDIPRPGRVTARSPLAGCER